DLVDELVDQREVGLAIEVALDHLLGQLERELAHARAQVGGGTGDLGLYLLPCPLLARRHLRLGLPAQVLAELVGRLPRLLDDASRLGSGIGQLRLVLGEDRLRLGLRPLGLVEARADALSPGVHAVADGREREAPKQEEEHDEGEGTPDELVRRGQDRVGRLLARRHILTALEELDALLVHVRQLLRRRRRLSPRRRRRGQQGDAGDGAPEDHGSRAHPHQPFRRKVRTNPKSASASVKAMTRNIVVSTMPAASGLRALQVMACTMNMLMQSPGPTVWARWPN